MKRDMKSKMRYLLSAVRLLAVVGIVIFLGACSSPIDRQVHYENDLYGFSLSMPGDFVEAVEIREEGYHVYFVSKEIQKLADDQMLGVVGRIEVFSKKDHTKADIEEIAGMTGLRLLDENEEYFFGWTHATDVQVPMDVPADTKETFSRLEKQFDGIIESFVIRDAGNQQEASASAADTDSYSLMIGQKAVSLKSWDTEADLSGVLGNPISETVEVLGTDSDTFAGSSVKTLEYDGLKIRLFSPKDNGKAYWIMSMDLTGSTLQTPKGITVGSSLEALKGAYGLLEAVPDGRTDAENRAYQVSMQAESEHMLFEVEKGYVKEIKLYVELP